MAMEISSAYNSYASTSFVAKAGTSDYLAELQKKNSKLNLLTGYSNGTPGSSNYPEKINVTIAPEFIAKMEADPKLAAEYEKNLTDIPAACKWGESMIRAMTGNTVYEFRFYIDENGNMSAGSVSGPREKREMFERSRQKARQQKEEFDKRIEERIKASAEKKEKETSHTHEVRIAGNDVKSLTEKLVEASAKQQMMVGSNLDLQA